MRLSNEITRAIQDGAGAITDEIEGNADRPTGRRMTLRRSNVSKLLPALYFLLSFHILAYAPQFHETESGSGAKNTAHHYDHLNIHSRGLLSPSLTCVRAAD